MCAFLLLTAAATAAEGSAPPDAELRGLLSTYCIDCHNADLTEGEFDATLLTDGRLPADQRGRMLENMRRRVAAGEMPPDDVRSLSRSERGELSDALTGALRRLSEQYRDDPGPIVMPRLTPAQFRHVIRDLSGGVVTDGGRYLPNEGGAGEGFAGVGQAQSMTTAQLEKYLEAARGALHHLRAYPDPDASSAEFVWRARPRAAVPAPADARRELTDDIIAWHVGQQQKWNEEHRRSLNERFGYVHAVYLEAAWRYHWRQELGRPDASWLTFSQYDGVSLAPVVLKKWYHILSAAEPQPPFAAWAEAWRALPPPSQITARNLRERCIAIERGHSDVAKPADDEFAPPWEISFHEAREEVLAAAADGRWPFRIDVGDADVLFLVATDAGDGNRGEYAIWQHGRILFDDGTAQPWEDVVTVRGANSGNEFSWGIDGEGAARLPGHSIGVRPPGALKFDVPDGAQVFEVELVIDDNRTDAASIQALVLREKPKSQSYVPGRAVFGGRQRNAGDTTLNKELQRALRKRNVAEANLTKIGLNAERNVFAGWNRTPIEHIGGPWTDQVADQEEPLSPYHLTVDQVRRNANAGDLAELTVLLDRLSAVAQSPQQELLSLVRQNGTEHAKEGVIPDDQQTADWPAAARTTLHTLAGNIAAEEDALATHARGRIAKFAARAWRRPLTTAERDRLLTLYRESRAAGFSFDAAVKSSLMAVLASPHFLYRHVSVGHAQTTGNARTTDAAVGPPETVPLNGCELASRLSFFLWASIPDEELLQLAADDRLADPDILRAQARRMLKDPKARSLATDFGGQLWSFADFRTFQQPDADRFPEFTPALREAMFEEVIASLDDVFRNDRPLTNLLDAEFAFVNEELARHYALVDRWKRRSANSGSSASEFLRVPLPPGDARGGLATMGLFLTRTSLPLRTSPVQRGVWVMEQLLGRELPNPPADVPPLSDDDTNADGESIRAQLEQHRASTTCASCHDKIDPLGLALENFDAVGRWRQSGRDGQPLSTTATTQDGTPLDGPRALKAYLVAHQEEFIRHFNRKLLGYALGRAVHPGDTALLDDLSARLQASHGRFSALVEAIVTSPQFVTRRRAGVPR